MLARFRRHRLAMVGLVLIALFVTAGVFAPWVAPYDYEATDWDNVLAPPSSQYWLGTDELGRDMLSRIIHGARISMVIGLISVSIGMSVGIPLGLLAGYYGGWPDLLLERLVDIMLAFPSVLLALVLVAILGVGLTNVMIAVGIVSIPIYARLVRGSVLGIKEEDYVVAARAAGSRDLRVMVRHVLPGCMAPILVQSTLQVASAILSAAALGFLGLGASPDTPEWGIMLSKGRTWIVSSPHVTTFPGLAIMLTVLGFNLVGDALRDALDPRLKS